MLMHITMPGACGFFVEKMFIFLPDSTVLFLPYLCYTVAVTIGGGNDCREILPGAITRKLCENMKLHLSSSGGVTPIENIFIDQYMPKANGEFVKLYLYLLRCAGTDRELSLSSIADVFDHTEKDVKRALSYWEKLELLKLQYDSNGGFSDIHFLNGSDPDVRGNGVSFDEPPSGQTSSDEGDLPKPKPKSSLTRDRKKQLKEQQQIKQLIFVAEQYYARPLTSTEQSDLLYFYDTLHFSEDLIEYLIEYCVSKGSTGAHYMEKVAQEWYNEGITTVAQAKKTTNLYNKNYYAIFHALGIKNRNPVPLETEYMDRWLNHYGFSTEVVLEACARTIRQIHEPKFEYIDSILERWKKAGVHQLSDLKALDAEHSERKTRTVSYTKKTAASNRFNNFPQREYNWAQLEQQLLNAQSRKEG